MRVCDRCRATPILDYEIRFGRSGNYTSGFTRSHELCTNCVEWVINELKELSVKITDSSLSFPNYLITYPPGTSISQGESIDNSKLAKNIAIALDKNDPVTIPFGYGWKVMAKQPDGTWINIGGGDEEIESDKYLDSHAFPFECRTVLASQYMECKYCGKSLGEIKELKLYCPSMKSTR